MLSFIKKKDRRLGVADRKRQYDLPLNQDEGTLFLKILIGLMSFLAIMALAFSFSLGHLADEWSSGLENSLTIEISAQTKDEKMHTKEEMQEIQNKISTIIKGMPSVQTFKVLQNDDIQSLISPWLGDDLKLANLPLPGLISVELKSNENFALAKLRGEMAAISPDIHVDAHEDWLSSILQLTGGLQFAGLLITFVIGLTTIAAVAGAVRSRMAIHRADVELLHLMGANDIYITKQFQRHAMILALHGSLFGTGASIIALISIHMLSSQSAESLVPSFDLGINHMIAIIALPIVACLVSALVARYTVLRTLGSMP